MNTVDSLKKTNNNIVQGVVELYSKIADQGYTIVFLTNRSGKRTTYKVKAGNVFTIAERKTHENIIPCYFLTDTISVLFFKLISGGYVFKNRI